MNLVKNRENLKRKIPKINFIKRAADNAAFFMCDDFDFSLLFLIRGEFFISVIIL